MSEDDYVPQWMLDNVEAGYDRLEAERDVARADLARAQATIAAVRALCDEMETWPVQTPKAIALHLRRALDGTTEATP